MPAFHSFSSTSSSSSSNSKVTDCVLMDNVPHTGEKEEVEKDAEQAGKNLALKMMMMMTMIMVAMFMIIDYFQVLI